MANDDFRNYRDEYQLETELIRQGKVQTRMEARKKVRERLIPLESHYQKKILAALRKEFPGGRFWKNAAGIGQAAGEPDLEGVLDGRFIAVEVKRPLLGIVSPLQKKAIREIRAAGGCAMIGTYADEVVEAVQRYIDSDGCGNMDYWEYLTGGKAAVCMEESHEKKLASAVRRGGAAVKLPCPIT